MEETNTKVPDIVYEELCRLLNYDPATGIFHWKVPVGRYNRISAGSIAGAKRIDGAVQICIYRKFYLAHRLAWFYVMGEWPKLEIDHIDNNPSNNKFCNLRLATRSQNEANKPPKKGNLDKGVSYEKRGNSYVARVKKNGKKFYLGTFKTKEEAANAYRMASIDLWGEYAWYSSRI